jgi:hypothetical protein
VFLGMLYYNGVSETGEILKSLSETQEITKTKVEILAIIRDKRDNGAIPKLFL